MIGFTSSSTFMLWLNCNQELGRSYGMTDSSAIQSFYALGTATAILATTFLNQKRSERNQCPDPVSGDFYCDAGSVLPDSGTMDLSGGRICDWLCRRRRSPSAGNIHNRRILPGKQRNSDLHGNDRIQYCELYHHLSGKLHYQGRRSICSENDSSSEHGSYRGGNPSCFICKEEQR